MRTCPHAHMLTCAHAHMPTCPHTRCAQPLSMLACSACPRPSRRLADGLADLQLDNPAARERAADFLAAARKAGVVSEEDAELAAATSDLPAAPVSPASVTSFKTACLSALQEYLSSADVEEVRGPACAGAGWGEGGLLSAWLCTAACCDNSAQCCSCCTWRMFGQAVTLFMHCIPWPIRPHGCVHASPRRWPPAWLSSASLAWRTCW
jgi:hypothetical protein